MDIVDRAIAYVAKMDAAISGSNGHDVTFGVACVLVKGFDLSDDVALGVMRDHFNPRCSPPWSEAELRHKVSSARRAAGEVGYLLKSAYNGDAARGGGSGSGAGGYFQDYKATLDLKAKRAEAVRRKDMGVDEVERQRLLRGYGVSGIVDLMERSPVDVKLVDGAADFLSYLYDDGECVLIFTDFRSQGDFGFMSRVRDGVRGGGVWRLGARRGVAAERAVVPESAPEGVWYLCNPVCGKWVRSGAKNKDGSPKLSRRSSANVTAWRYMLLEADDVDPDEWLAVVSQLPLAVAAIYTSGGRSMHVLVRVDALSRDDFFRIAKKVEPVVAALGGDPAAISGVRLTRLPFCHREGGSGKDGKYVRYDKPRLQRLLYLNPAPEVRELCKMKRVRAYMVRDEAGAVVRGDLENMNDGGDK